MLSIHLIKLIENHAESLTHEVVEDLRTNAHTPSQVYIPREELASRIFALYRNLGNWIGEPKDDAIRSEYERWGGIRRAQGIPPSELVYCLILTKKHLRRYIREYWSVVFSGDRMATGELAPLELYSIQELNYLVGDFFDRALYYLLRGYETQFVEPKNKNRGEEFFQTLPSRPRN
jgi:hypothetical protein